MVRSIKHLAMVHAYRPQQLKECLVSNPNAYTNMFSSDGKCSNDMFFRSTVAHFREWKKELEKRLLEVFNIIVATDEVLQP
jgi:hypothetical protein